MEGTDSAQPKPNTLLPPPESYCKPSWGPKPCRPGLVAMGMLNEAVPVAGLIDSFSSMPRKAPPPLGSVTAGLDVAWPSAETSEMGCAVVRLAGLASAEEGLDIGSRELDGDAFGVRNGPRCGDLLVTESFPSGVVFLTDDQYLSAAHRLCVAESFDANSVFVRSQLS